MVWTQSMSALGRLISSTSVKSVLRGTGSVHGARIRNMSTRKSLDLSGIYPPLATPFTASEEIDWEQLASNIQKYNNIGFRGYCVQGSNGEYVYLSKEERLEQVRRVREMASKDKLLLAGSGCESTRDTIEMSNKMADAGADAVLVVTPNYYKRCMLADAMIDHYTKVADACKVPVLLYNVPFNTGIDLSADVVIKLSKHPNIIGMKESGGNLSKIGRMLFETKNQDFQILAGSGSFLLPAFAVGCVGGLCALANVLGPEICELYNLYRQGRHEEAKDLQLRLVAPNAAVTHNFGVPGLKAVLDWFGYHGGHMRAPLQPLTAEQLAKAKAIFKASGFQP